LGGTTIPISKKFIREIIIKIRKKNIKNKFINISIVEYIFSNIKIFINKHFLIKLNK